MKFMSLDSVISLLASGGWVRSKKEKTIEQNKGFFPPSNQFVFNSGSMVNVVNGGNYIIGNGCGPVTYTSTGNYIIVGTGAGGGCGGAATYTTTSTSNYAITFGN